MGPRCVMTFLIISKVLPVLLRSSRLQIGSGVVGRGWGGGRGHSPQKLRYSAFPKNPWGQTNIVLPSS